MSRALYSVVSGGLAELSRLDVVAQNLANASTSGYKAQELVFEVKPAKARGSSLAGLTMQRASAQVLERATVTDFSQGPIERTGNPLDVALAGEGFFVVATARGDRFTRAGSLTITPEGKLATAAGHALQGDSGDLTLPPGKVEIAEDGLVSVDGNPAGRIRVVTFEKTNRLVREGESLFAAGPQPPVDPPPGQVRIVQGAVEKANVSVIRSLVDMVETTRAFDAYMRAIQRMDSINGRAIGDLGRV